jgi:hypothetical protein
VAVNTRNMVIEMNAKADTINVELDRQINALDNIYDNMKDTETTLKRYFIFKVEHRNILDILLDRFILIV